MKQNLISDTLIEPLAISAQITNPRESTTQQVVLAKNMATLENGFVGNYKDSGLGTNKWFGLGVIGVTDPEMRGKMILSYSLSVFYKRAQNLNFAVPFIAEIESTDQTRWQKDDVILQFGQNGSLVWFPTVEGHTIGGAQNIQCRGTIIVDTSIRTALANADEKAIVMGLAANSNSNSIEAYVSSHLRLHHEEVVTFNPSL